MYFNDSFTSACDTSQKRSDPSKTVGFLFSIFLMGALIRIALRKWSVLMDSWKWGSLCKLPYTAFLMVLGLIIAAIGARHPCFDTYILQNVDPNMFFHIFLPIVFFHAVFVIDQHIFRRTFTHIVILAIPGLVVSGILTACIMVLFPAFDLIGKISMSMKWYLALIFGASISVTDPVAVADLLKDMSSQKYLTTIIEGEGVINDATDLVFYNVVFELLKSEVATEQRLESGDIAQLVLFPFLGGPIIGWLTASFTAFVLRRIYNDAVSEITVTLAMVYLSFWVGELIPNWHCGVPAVVCFGMMLDKSAVSRQVDAFLAMFIEVGAYLSNTMIFVYVGIMTYGTLENKGSTEFGFLILLYICTTLIRGISVFLFYPIVHYLKTDISWKDMVVTVWGGLRGAIGLVLAIRSRYDLLKLHLASVTTTESEQLSSVFDMMLFYSGGVVLMTLLINASTIEALLQKLGLLDISKPQRLAMRNAVENLQDNVHKKITQLKCDKFLSDAKWDMVEEMTTIEFPYQEERFVRNKIYTKDNDSCQNDEPDTSEISISELEEETRLRMMKSVKMSYGKQYKNGTLEGYERRVLVHAANKAYDKPGSLIDIDQLRTFWTVNGIYPFLKDKLEKAKYSSKSSNLKYEPPANRIRKKVFNIVNHPVFDYIMQIVIVLNLIPIIMDFTIGQRVENSLDYVYSNLETQNRTLKTTFQSESSKYDGLSDFVYGLFATNIIFFIIYCLEMALKLIGLGYKQYWRSHWNKVDVIILLLAFIDIVVEIIMLSLNQSSVTNLSAVKTTKVAKFLRISKLTKPLRMFRVTRIVRLSKTIIPRLIKYTEQKINEKMRVGYSIGKAYIRAEEEGCKLVANICAHREAKDKLMQDSISNRLIVIREIGVLSQKYPKVATSVKSSNAVRTLLNHSKMLVYQLYCGGVLDEIEKGLLDRSIEKRLKQQASFPSTVTPQTSHEIIENIVWMKNNQPMIDLIKKHAEPMECDAGDEILGMDKNCNGIYIITKGLLKVDETPKLYNKMRERAFSLGSIPLLIKAEEHDVREDWSVFQEDYVGAGHVIGEIAMLTHCKMPASVIAETKSQLYFVSKDTINNALYHYPGLEHRLWKFVAKQICCPLYNSSSFYQAYTQEEINMHLAKGYIVQLNRFNMAFYFTGDVLEACLVYGSVLSPHLDEIFDKPFLALPDLNELHLYKCDHAVLLVIPQDLPNESSDLDVLTHRRRRGTEILEMRSMPQAINYNALKLRRGTQIYKR